MTPWLSLNPRILRMLLGILVPLALWSVISATELIRPLFLPSPIAVSRAFIELLVSYALVADVLASLFRILCGFLLSLVVALPIGLLLGRHKPSAAFSDPFLSFLRYIPPSAVLPLFILWFGIGEGEKILVIAAGVIPYLILLVSTTVANVPHEYLETASTLGASRNAVLARVIIPYALPGVMDALRLMMAFAWTLVIIAELIAAESGLGHLIILSQRFLATPKVFVALITIGCLGFMMDLLFQKAHLFLFPWTHMEPYARTK